MDIYRKAIVAAAVGALLALVPATVWAIAAPDTMQVNSVRCYQSLNETGDILCVVYYEITYTTMPSEDADEAYLGRFLTATQESNSVAPYVYSGTISATSSPPAQGYGEGVLSFYWSAADVVDYGMTWNSSGNTVILQSNPLIDEAGNVTPVRYTSIDWWTADGTRDQLGKDIRNIANDIEKDWVSNSIDLEDTVSNKWVLTTEGAGYFLQAVPNLDVFAPDIFTSRVLTPLVSERTMPTSTASEYEAFWAGTDIADGFQAVGDLIGISSLLARTMILFLIMGAVAFLAFKITGRGDMALLVALGVAFPLGAVVGMIAMAAVLSVALLGALVLGFQYVYGKG